MQQLQLSEATAAQRRLFFHAVDATDGIAAETGLTGVGRLSKNGATTAATSASISEIDSTNMPGRYYIEFGATELDTVGIIEFRYKAAACAEVVARAQVVPFDPYDAVRMGLTALPNAAAEAAGGLYTRGTGAGQINQGANGMVDVNVEQWLDSVVNALQSGRVDSYLGALAADVITAAGIADNAFVAANFAAGAYDAVWSVAARILTANTNFNDPTAATIADAVWDEDIEAAHGGDAAAGLLLRALGAAISNRANNATLNALLGVADSAGVDLVDEILDGHTMAELAQQLPPAAPTFREAVMLLYMGYRDETITSATLHSIKNDAGVVLAKQTLADASGTLTRSKMVTGP